MKLRGFGAADSIARLGGRFDQMKTGTEGVSTKTPPAASDTAAGAKAQGAALSSKTSATKNSKSTVRSSNASKQVSKDFSTVLSEASDETETKSLLKSESKSDPNQEALAAATSVANATSSKPADRTVKPVAAPENRETDQIDAVNGGRQAIEPKGETQAEPGSIEEKINDIASVLDEASQEELSMRHLSMRDFLSKMKTEFGVEPKAVVNAFAKLDSTALMAPPEQTATAVLSQLGLKPEQMPKAERFYREMLNETGESALNETLVGVGAGISLKVLSEQDLAMDKLQRSIAGLNDAFARRNENSELSAKAGAIGANGIGVGLENVEIPVAVATASMPAIALTTMEAGEADAATESLEVPTKSAVGTSSEPGQKKSDGKSESKFASLGAALSSATAGLAASMTGNGSGASSGGEQAKAKDASASDTAPKAKAFDSIESALAATRFESANMGGERAATPLAAGTATSAALAATLANHNGDGTTTNAQDLVRHAQMLVKNGGGEMKMQLKPEGVGDVTLKVAVKDGQVQIQMMTETDSAKKVLENNLDDLKTSLAQHKLHVDAVKIEVGGEMAKQRFEQAQQDANREQTRQMAQDFMSQFRQDREGFRQGFGDLSGFRNYDQGRKNPLPDMEPVVASSKSAKEKSSGSRRLDLVA